MQYTARARLVENHPFSPVLSKSWLCFSLSATRSEMVFLVLSPMIREISSGSFQRYPKRKGRDCIQWNFMDRKERSQIFRRFKNCLGHVFLQKSSSSIWSLWIDFFLDREEHSLQHGISLNHLGNLSRQPLFS